MNEPLTPESKLSRALKLHPDVLEYVISLNPHEFSRLRAPLLRQVMPARITLARLAVMLDMPVSNLLKGIYRAAQIELSSSELERLENLDDGQNELELPQSSHDAPQWSRQQVVAVVDLLESDDRLDTDPFVPLFPVINRANPGDVILLKHRWEPQPLFDVWKKLNIDFYSKQKSPDEWWIYLRVGNRPNKRRFRKD